MGERQYLCIDLKSFYASVECAARGLDPMTTNLVVADGTRTEKTICLAVSPSMKALGVRNRCRVFEIPKGIPYTMAPPRMARYIQKSAEIYGTYHPLVAADMAAYSEHWKQYEGKVAEVSESVNNTYLVIQGAPDGVRSYGRVVDLMLAWYDAQK